MLSIILISKLYIKKLLSKLGARLRINTRPYSFRLRFASLNLLEARISKMQPTLNGQQLMTYLAWDVA
jgi:hypothetical protein